MSELEQKIIGIIHKWIQWNCIGGSTFTWGSSEPIIDMTVVKLEHLGKYIANNLNKG